MTPSQQLIRLASSLTSSRVNEPNHPTRNPTMNYPHSSTKSASKIKNTNVQKRRHTSDKPPNVEKTSVHADYSKEKDISPNKRKSDKPPNAEKISVHRLFEGKRYFT